jgi:hypothetical protein
VVRFLERKINKKYEEQIAKKRAMNMKKTEIWRSIYNNYLDSVIIKWRDEKLKQERDLFVKRREQKRNEMEQEKLFKQSQKKKIVINKFGKKLVQEESECLEKENLRITLKRTN